jgi:peptidoglycan/LPS O-acetylase OafA/YrhL
VSTTSDTTPSTTRAVERASAHVSALDGVRGLAILLVAAYHFVWQASLLAPGESWVYRVVTRGASLGIDGVDLFFVLSGFLITGILLDAKTSAHFLRNFYARRVLRIFPLYYAFLVLLLVLLPMVRPDAISGELAHDQGWVWSYATNVKLALTNRWVFCGGVSCGDGVDLNHTWSLAVEEHFYLGWPVVVLACSRRALMRWCVALSLAAIVLRVVLHRHPLAMYVLTPCRMDTLLIGAFVAAAVRERGLEWVVRVARWPTAVAAVLFAIVTLLPGGTTARPPVVRALAYSLAAILSAALVVAAVASAAISRKGGRLARMLSTPVLRTFGKYSYGMYLFHATLRPILERAFPPATLARALRSPTLGVLVYFALGSTVSLAAAWFSYHLFEKRFLRLKAMLVDERSWLPGQPAAEPGDGANHA